MEGKLPALLVHKVTAPTAYVRWLQQSQSEAAQKAQKTQSILYCGTACEVKTMHPKKKKVIADVDTLDDPKPLMSLRAKKSNHEEVSSVSNLQKRWPRSSSTPALEEAAGRKKLDPLPMKPSVKKSNAEEFCSSLSQRPSTSSTSSFRFRSSSAPALQKAVGRQILAPLPKEPHGKESNDKEIFTSLSCSQKRASTPSMMPKLSLNRDQRYQSLLNNSTDDVRLLKERMPQSAKGVRRSREQKHITQIPQPQRKSPVTNVKADEGDEVRSDASQKHVKEPTPSKYDEFKQTRGQESEAFGALGDFCKISKDLNCPLDTTKDARSLFERYAQAQGDLDYQEFGEIVLHILKSTAQTLSQEDLEKKIEASWREADRNHNGKVNFEEFVNWYSSWGFQQELLLSPRRIRCRDFAKKYDLSIADVETAQAKFRLFDEDGSGEIEFHEFEKLFCKLMKVPRGQELPANRLKHFWKEIDSDDSGSIDFDEFLQWYIKYFDMTGLSKISPIEQFYKSVRPGHFWA
eukprot:gnl/MRDRNA2_/MRDRNA2_81021_c0_seq1.p1 gnl/MRDRNA2_/MRDRNA2_81021_c0~~gnl/MRDRNA2_/MRDRNA2_81021_c0_seq1.p1  ORF type:complete len:518 (-),score=107.81 gnl/MRDRNA2_/MRDRNA2_81021_c0_seq1:492-2045(-)